MISLTTAPMASAVSDVTGPVLVSSTVTPKSLNIATGPATVKVTLRLTDRTGTSSPVLSVSHDATGQSHGFGSMNLVSGTAKDGTWERSVSIPKGSATGNWTVRLFPLSDTLGNRSGGFRDLATLNVTATIPKLSLTAAPVPVVTGTAKVGSTLAATVGSWSPAPVALIYQWYRSGVVITGATAASYKLTANEAGKAITVRVTGSKAGFATAAKTSAGTRLVVG
jgi:hypothetical protein